MLRKKMVLKLIVLFTVLLSANLAWGAVFDYGPKVLYNAQKATDATMKLDYNYEDGKYTEQVMYLRQDSTEGWSDPHQKVTFEYAGPDSLNVVKEVKQRYNSYNNTWEDNQKIEYTYNDSDDLKNKIIYEFDNNAWVKDSKMEYHYQRSGKVDKIISYNSTQGAFVQNGKIEYAYYSSNDLRKSEIVYSLDNGVWEESSKLEYEYDQDNKVLNATSFRYQSSTNSVDGEWIKSHKTNIEYMDNSNRLAIRKSYSYNASGQNATRDSFKEFIFNAEDKLDHTISTDYTSANNSSITWHYQYTTEVDSSIYEESYAPEEHWQQWQSNYYGQVGSKSRDIGENGDGGGGGCIMNPSASFDCAWLFLLLVPAYIVARRKNAKT